MTVVGEFIKGSKLSGGRAYRQHQTLKRFVRERDNYTCQLCGTEGWIVDHIRPWRVSHDSTLSNLRVLCHACNLKRRMKRIDAAMSSEEHEEWIKKELCENG